MKSPITRWNTVPSYRRAVERCPVRGSVHSRSPRASSVKLATVLGACSGIRRTLNSPSEVTNVAVGMAKPPVGVRSPAVYPRGAGALLHARLGGDAAGLSGV